MSYADFLQRKARVWRDAGIPADPPDFLYPFQRAITSWAIRKGRAAIFADCGLGKTPMQLAWATLTGERTLIVAPLCVADQTVSEAAKFGIAARYAARDDGSPGIVVTNYERIDNFDASDFGAVVLDESSILKSFDGKTRTKLIQKFRDTRFRLACTATPAPNDIAELANHSEFLGIMPRNEFLASWFVHDDAGWRMKKHAVEPFYRWLASWSCVIRRPSDIGFDDDGFILPALDIRERMIEMPHQYSGTLFPSMIAKGVKGRLAARKGSVEERCKAAAELCNHGSKDQWIMWCGLNDESDRLAESIEGAVAVSGNDEHADKVAAVFDFLSGKTRVLVSKPRILGFGMNFQNCANMAFVGLSDSYEAYYQCLRRCWRYGQTRQVTAHVVVSEAEHAVVQNIIRKEKQADEIHSQMLAHLLSIGQVESCA